MFSALKRAARAALETRGFYLRHRAVLPYGIDFIFDVKRLMPDVRSFFDIGAWHGEVSKKALDEFPNAHVIAFDPNPESFGLLSRQELAWSSEMRLRRESRLIAQPLMHFASSTIFI